MTGFLRLFDDKEQIVWTERFQTKSILKKKLKAMHVKHWNKLESEGWQISILMDAEEGENNNINTSWR